MSKFTLKFNGKFTRLEKTGAHWLASKFQAEGLVCLTRKSSAMFDFYMKGTTTSLPTSFDVWFALAARDELMTTQWSKFFSQPTNDFAFVSKEDARTVLKDVHLAVSAALNK